MHRSKRRRASWIAIVDLAQQTIPSTTDRASVKRSRCSRRSRERCAMTFIQIVGARLSCLNSALLEFCANASCLSPRARQSPCIEKFDSISPSSISHRPVIAPFCTAADCLSARRRCHQRLARKNESARHFLSRANDAICLPGRVYSDERVTLVQSCEKAILRAIRHAKSR